MTTYIKSEIDAAVARANAATPGEWELWDGSSWRRFGVKQGSQKPHIEPCIARDGQPDIIISKEDADLIVHARADILALADLARDGLRYREALEVIADIADEQGRYVLGDGHALVEIGQRARAAFGPQNRRDVAWLIERQFSIDMQPSETRWYAENEESGWHHWTPSALEAKRFASRADAEAFPPYKMIASDPAISITEHVFMAGTNTNPSPTEGQDTAGEPFTETDRAISDALAGGVGITKAIGDEAKRIAPEDFYETPLRARIAELEAALNGLLREIAALSGERS